MINFKALGDKIFDIFEGPKSRYDLCFDKVCLGFRNFPFCYLNILFSIPRVDLIKSCGFVFDSNFLQNFNID